MSAVDINCDVVNNHSGKPNSFTTEPVAMMWMVSVAIEAKAVQKCVRDRMLGEDAAACAEHTTENSSK